MGQEGLGGGVNYCKSETETETQSGIERHIRRDRE